MFSVIPALLLFRTSHSHCGKVAQLTSEAPYRLVSLVSSHYHRGNWDGLMEAIKKSLNKTKIKTLYLGDNFIQDLYTPSKYTHCDTVAVCAEQAAEGFHTKLDPDSSHLKSNLWDSYFYIRSNEKKYPTIWSDILKKHCKICVPSISYLASEPINKTYTTFDHEDSGFNTAGFHPNK
uniref:5'-nucleotidase domain-containing protein 1 n=1 Tax=Cacopsylla melanoneura TaxID=428564 RepID=A0A8D9A0T4_9HEMI